MRSTICRISARYLRKTPLWKLHKEQNATMAEFAGFDMPMIYKVSSLIRCRISDQTVNSCEENGQLVVLKILLKSAERSEIFQILIFDANLCFAVLASFRAFSFAALSQFK
jgi:hypothetical protein